MASLFSKKSIFFFVILSLLFASLVIYGETIRYQGFSSLKSHQKIVSYSFRTNRYIIVHLQNGSEVDVNLNANQLHVQAGTKNSLSNFQSVKSVSNKTGYLLTLTPKEFQIFNEKFSNSYGNDGKMLHDQTNHLELVTVSI